ncbi:putative 2-dehydropantoate 2-reductase [Phialemonium atrogriseum]|uniref:2-dehydropantoate 2-reductase n=1 Tax=Phialemonium atrogriseum TaxID=1093897 RepID=A0AAJ0FGL8_9PEZI|nr:putative 2-dehydropantoate 2-reductase [Phialemonium atrogriseum]KAK1767741.1 putative 2-dehydropantoate 2-reductase [Phialemonium atrogriseum]
MPRANSFRRPVNIVFVGAGAVGCFYASRLHHPTHNIHTSLIARSNYKAIAANGVQMQTHSFGDYTFAPAAAFPTVAVAAAGARDWHYIIVTTKALPDRTDDSELIAPLVGPRSCIVLIQNGVGVEDPYRRRFPQTPIVSAVTVISAEQVAPGAIRQNRWTRIHLGPYTNSASSSPSAASVRQSPSATKSGADTTGAVTSAGGVPAGDSSADADAAAAQLLLLAQRGVACTAALADWWSRLGSIRDAEVSDEVGLQTVRWHKLCINAAFNPSAVLSGGRGNADMAGDPELRRHLAGVMEEIRAAAPAVLGRPFPEEMAGPERILRSTERNVGGRPSMLLDWEARRPLEIEVILGNPVRIARAKGVELPRLQSLYALLRSVQAMREAEVEGKRAKGKL